MFRLVRTTSLAVALVIGIAATAWAQGRTGGSGFGGSGFGGGLGGSGFGGSAFGGSGFGGSGFGGSGFGGSGFGGSGFGGSAFGSGFGGSGFGGSGFGGSGFGGSGLGGSGFGGSGMYGGQGGGQAFVGRDSGDMNAVMTQMGRAGTQFFNNMNRNMGAGGRNRNRNNQQAQSEEHVESAVRVKLSVGFPHPRPAANVLADSVRTRLNGVLSTPGIAQPDVTVAGGVIVLRGEAASDTQRAVIAQVVAMEPGVTSVRNEMTVAPAEGEE